MYQLVDGINPNAEPNNTSITNPDVEEAIYFKPKGTYQIRRIELWTGKAGAKELALTIRLRQNNGGRPGPVVREAKVTTTEAADGWYGTDFAEAYPVSRDETYWVCFKGETVANSPIKYLARYQEETGQIVETLLFSGLDMMFRSPRASEEWVRTSPEVQRAQYFWSIDGKHWSGPYYGYHMIRIYGTP